MSSSTANNHEKNEALTREFLSPAMPSRQEKNSPRHEHSLHDDRLGSSLLYPRVATTHKIDKHLVIFRYIAVILWIGALIFDAVAYLRKIPNKFGFRFAYNLNFLVYEISVLIYASGAPAMGPGLELVILLLLTVINFILSAINCDTQERYIAGIWIGKTISLLLGTKLVHHNFCKNFPKSYKNSFNSSASNMLHQALSFSMIMLFLMAPGFRAIWDAADIDRHCNYKNQTCHFFNMLNPNFYEGDICEIHHIEYLKGREELRTLRTFMLLNMVSYSIYNQALLEIVRQHQSRLYYLVKPLTILAFIALSLAVLITCTHPFKYSELKPIFDGMEMSFIGIALVCLFVNLLRLKFEKQGTPEHEEMEMKPHVLPHH